MDSLNRKSFFQYVMSQTYGRSASLVFGRVIGLRARKSYIDRDTGEEVHPGHVCTFLYPGSDGQSTICIDASCKDTYLQIQENLESKNDLMLFGHRFGVYKGHNYNSIFAVASVEELQYYLDYGNMSDVSID